jgi:hypothetical protein
VLAPAWKGLVFLKLSIFKTQQKRIIICKGSLTKQGGKMSDKIEISTGVLAPDFQLDSTAGNQVSLSDYRGKKNVYLFFIREFN